VLDILYKYFHLLLFLVDLNLLDFQLLRHFTNIDSGILEPLEPHCVPVDYFLDLVAVEA
jgi:hypothetical protein